MRIIFGRLAFRTWKPFSLKPTFQSATPHLQILIEYIFCETTELHQNVEAFSRHLEVFLEVDY